ncbi:hypothetical protein CCR96_23065 [Halochromatium roseum]|nr:hypothetical protein [Halochromatium roseum]
MAALSASARLIPERRSNAGRTQCKASKHSLRDKRYTITRHSQGFQHATNMIGGPISPALRNSAMNHRFAFFALLIALPLAISTSTLASEIGYVDMQRVLEESQLGKTAQANLQERFGDEQRAFAEEEAAIRQLQQKLERDKPLMSTTQVEKTEEEIMSRIKQFEQDFAKIQQQLAQAQQQEGQKILKPARDAVISVAKKRKIDAVFEANQAGIVYLDEDGDLTDAVIKAMDAGTN